ncbi:uncharacterized protein TM35_000062650 [Trypanosoma theileri]|uniref:Uncharacterized protein n=1 Tax=Trypanosoma theileri TaxID=67003 RepID=A0A1X0P490_9TRYP|nr:uncharacterized protein TM35_000062650 [Trypanosoma theileri]ORC91260.1 hypothetical protein TM35_000062650 [Trypanosoma theileri]
MCEPNRTAWQWSDVKEPHLHSSRSHTCRWTSPRRHSVHPTETAAEWSRNTTASSPLTVHTYTMTVSHAHIREALPHSQKYTPSHTPTERKSKTQEKNNNNNRIPTAHTKHSQYNNHSCHSHQRKTFTHTSTSTQPQKEKKKKTDPLREAEADQSQSISPQAAVTQASHTPNNTHNTRAEICSWQCRE